MAAAEPVGDVPRRQQAVGGSRVIASPERHEAFDERQRRAPPPFGDLDTALFETVEIVRGANAIMTGIGNPSATVNYVRKRPTDAFTVRASGQVGTRDYWRFQGDVNVPLTDRLAPGEASRAITLYTSSFSFGVGLSFLISQLVAEGWGWRAAFLVTAFGPLLMLAVCLLLRPVEPKPAQGRLLDSRVIGCQRRFKIRGSGMIVNCMDDCVLQKCVRGAGERLPEVGKRFGRAAARQGLGGG